MISATHAIYIVQFVMEFVFFFQISGTIEASDNPSDFSKDRTHWLMFNGVQKLSVKGGGIIDGNGNIWWKNSCKRNKKLVRYIR